MNKKRRTIDGLVVRDISAKRTVGFSEGKKEQEARALGVTGERVEVRTSKTRPSTRSERAPVKQSQTERPNDKIGEFLEEVKDENPTDLEMSEEITGRKERKAGKKGRKEKSKKPQSKKKRVIKWIIIGIVALLIGLLAWKGTEIWGILNDALGAATGGRVGAGDIIGADPTVPLKQDANGRTNVLVIGTSGHDMDESDHDGAQLADTIMVVSLDQETGDVKTFSIPRDLVAKEKCTSTGKMNETYWCEYQKYTRDARYSSVKDDNDKLMELRWEYEERAGENFMKVVAEVTGLEMHYWAHVNWEALITVVDALGGIDVAIEYQGNKDSYTGDLPVIWTTDTRGIQDRNWDWACKNTCYYVKYANGERVHLDGVHTIALARARGESQPAYGTNGNWSREQNQQVILEAIIKRAKETNFVTNMDAALDIIRAVGDNLRMSFDAEAIRRGIYLADKIDVVNMKGIDLTSEFSSAMLPVPGVNDYQCGGPSPGCLSYVVPKAGTYNYSGLAAYIAKELQNNPIVEEGATIDVLNGTEQTGLAAKISGEMESEGYKIGTVGNTPDGVEYLETTIYRNSEKTATGTEKKLLEKFNGSNIKNGSLPSGIESTADFVVILGQNNI